MSRVHAFILCIGAAALGMWMYSYLPGWIGLVVGAALLACAVIASVVALFGKGVKGRATKLWKEFWDFLYGLE
ncbi:hypothetical protein [Stenotrophomonas sp. PS02289]|uniref:hypothetical protein n=1 Tax=Stenotrophomonas sp. PS02289 TaxID=2991422 RepID=UPI00249CD031|nr:hypothetical protein [Stenotrophomonas sp. PS02289]